MLLRERDLIEVVKGKAGDEAEGQASRGVLVELEAANLGRIPAR